MLNRDAFHTYQRRTVQFIADTPACALWLDMSMGKTVSTLTAVSDLLWSFDAGRVLVIAPKRVAFNVWPAEVKRWSHLDGLRVTVIKGSPEQRLKIVRDDTADVHVINRDLVPWLVDAVRGEPALRKFKKRFPYQVIVLDEASGFKDHRSKRFKALKRVRPELDRVIELTGTPAGQGLLGLWSQMYLIDGGQRLGKTYTTFRDRYFVGDYMGFNYELKPGAEQQIYDAIADVVLRLDASDYLDLPELVVDPVYVDLPPAARKVYDELEREFLVEVDGETVTAPNAAALTGKLLQCANGAIYVDEDRNWRELHSAKLDAFADIADEYAGRPILAAYAFKFDLDRLRKRFPNGVVLDDDPATVDRWNRGEIEKLWTHPASAGHGLNLQGGGNVAVWYGLNWSLELYLQFNARLRRQGQIADRVFVRPIVARDTADESVLASWETNNTNQRALLDALKRDAKDRQCRR